MTDNEMLESILSALKPISGKLEDISLRLEQSQIENKIALRKIQKDIDKLNDEMETIVTVLQGKDILPIAK